MPVMDGFTLIRRLKESMELNCPIGIFTSLSHQQLISQAEGLGVNFVVTKYDDNMLAKEVLKVFSSRPQAILSNSP
jgi:CheY-like chemotaxis protein